MAFFNRVKFASSTNGVADFTVGAAVNGFQTPAGAGVTAGLPISYTAFSADLTQWETGKGFYTGTTISRVAIFDSSAGFGTKVNFTLNPTVQIDLLAADLLVDQYQTTYAV